jgi:RNA polymerase sigma factor (sigma-70 family)
LEQWLYQIANGQLESYISQERSTQKQRASTERLRSSELRSLEEIPFTADAEGEPWLPEDLDDSEIQPLDFDPPTDRNNPEAELERQEELEQILRALSRIPEPDRLVFDLVVIGGFSNQATASILGLRADEIPDILERAKRRVQEELNKNQATSDTRRRAS